MACHVLFSNVRDVGREHANETKWRHKEWQMKQSTVYGIAARRCSSATRVSLITYERKDSGRGNSCRHCVKKLMRRIGERGSQACANI